MRFLRLSLESLDHFFYHWSGGTSSCRSLFRCKRKYLGTSEVTRRSSAPFSVFEYIAYGRFRGSFLPAKVLSLISGMTAIILIFYSYTAVVGTHYLWADIATFFAGTALTWLLSYFLMKKGSFADIGIQLISRVLLAAVLVSFLLFTVDPPHLFLFKDPLTGQYGL